MPTEHKDTFDTVFKIDGVPVTGLNLDSIPIPDGEYDKKNVSFLGRGTAIKYALNMFDPGEAEVTGIFMPGDPGQAAMKAAFEDRQEHIFQVVLTESGTIFQYSGVLLSWGPSSDDNTALFAGKIAASGMFTATTTYAGITSIANATGGGTVVPSTAESALGSDVNTLVVIEATGTSSDTLTVTAASADYIGITKDGGKTWTELASGSASAAITLGAASTVTKVTVRVDEEDTATRFVDVYFARQ